MSEHPRCRTCEHWAERMPADDIPRHGPPPRPRAGDDGQCMLLTSGEDVYGDTGLWAAHSPNEPIYTFADFYCAHHTSVDLGE